MPAPPLTPTLTMKMTSAARRRTVVKVTNAAEFSSNQTLKIQEGVDSQSPEIIHIRN